MIVRLPAIALVLALFLTGCGSDGGETASTDATDGPPPSDGGGTGGDFCDDYEATIRASGALFGELFSEAPAPEPAMLAELSELVEAVVEAAPDEVAADVALVAANSQEMFDTLAEVDWTDPEQVAAVGEQLFVEDAELDAAADRIDDYAREECGFDPDEVAAEVTGDDPFGLEADCVDGELVAETTGIEIADTSVNSGAHGSTGGLSLAWSGCTYEAVDGGRFTIALLIGDDGQPSPDAFEQLADLTASDAGEVDDLGAAAFFDPSSALVVRTDTETFVFEIDGASLDPADHELLAEVARGVVGSADEGLIPRCETMQGLVPDAWGDAGDVLAGGGGDGDVEFDSCRVSISAVDGASLSMKIAQGTDWYDEQSADAGDDLPVAVDDLGDAAYAFADRLFVLAGDQVFVLVGQDADGEPLAPADLVELASAVVEAA